MRRCASPIYLRLAARRRSAAEYAYGVKLRLFRIPPNDHDCPLSNPSLWDRAEIVRPVDSHPAAQSLEVAAKPGGRDLRPESLERVGDEHRGIPSTDENLVRFHPLDVGGIIHGTDGPARGTTDDRVAGIIEHRGGVGFFWKKPSVLPYERRSHIGGRDQRREGEPGIIDRA